MSDARRDELSKWGVSESEQSAIPLDLPTPELLAMWFHDTYESLAPEHGYETRLSSREEWDRVPEQNRRLMVATASHVLRLLRQFVAGWDTRSPAFDGPKAAALAEVHSEGYRKGRMAAWDELRDWAEQNYDAARGPEERARRDAANRRGEQIIRENAEIAGSNPAAVPASRAAAASGPDAE